jgi:pyridoxal 5'-phosphate synthase pdxT subunit
VNRNHFGRQNESFAADLDLHFLASDVDQESRPFHSVFIRAPVVEKVLPHADGIQKEEAGRDGTVVAPSKTPKDNLARESYNANVEILARLPGRSLSLTEKGVLMEDMSEDGDIIAVRQGNCFGTSFHPELTGDPRIHVWWLRQVIEAVRRRWDIDQ